MVPSKIQNTSTLIAINTNISLYPGFSEKERKYVLAKTGNRIRVLVKEKKKNILIIELVKIISSAVFDCGQKMDAKDLELNANNLANYLDEKFPAITIQEVQLAFKMGAVGEFGEFYGMCLKTFNAWVKSYIESEEVRKACKTQLDYIESLKQEQEAIDEAIIEEKNKKATQNLINDFRLNHQTYTATQLMVFKNWASSYYDRNKELFPDDLEIENQALENILKSKQEKSFTLNEHRNNNQEFKKIQEQLFENKEVQIEYKFLLVRKWILSNN